MKSEKPRDRIFCRARLADGSSRRLTGRVTERQADGVRLREYSIRSNAPRAINVERVVLENTALDAGQVEVFRQGFFMPSDPTGFHVLAPGRPVPRDTQWRPDGWGARDFVSHGMAVYTLDRRPRRTLLGFTSFERFHGYFVFHAGGRGLRVLTVCELEGQALQPGEEVLVATVAVTESPDFQQVLDRYTACLAARYHPRIPRETATGWVDWQYYREEKDEQVIRANLGPLQRLRRQGAPLRYVIIDGGWCEHASEWLKPCAKFPSGMPALCRTIRKHGLVPGIWLAPYLTHVETEVVRRHPEWLALEKDGDKPLYKPASNVGPCHVIDFSVPQACAWLEQIVRTMVREWGVGYLKLDGPSLGHYRGARLRDPNMTVVEMIRRSLEVIRATAGDKVRIEGEGLYGPAIGLVDIQRTTQDPHPRWHGSLRENLKHDLLSGFLHRRLWHNHRENVILRDFSSPFAAGRARDPLYHEPILTENELRFQLTAATLGGGAMLLTDPMDQLARNPGRMALIGRFLPHYEGPAARPLDVFRGGKTPALFVLPVRRSFETWHMLGVFNWDETYRDYDVPLTSFAAAGRQHVFDVWNMSYLGSAARRLKVRDVPPHGCKLLGLRPLQPRPQLVGSDLHLLQGAVDLESLHTTARTLRFTVKHFDQHNRKLFLHVPPELRVTTVQSNARRLLVDRRKELILLHYDGRSRTDFTVRFRRAGA